MRLTLAALLLVHMVHANDITSYFNDIRESQNSDYSYELDLIKSTSFNQIVNEVSPFLNDSLLFIQQKANYFIYKKGIQIDDTINRKIAVNILLKTFASKNSILIGQNIKYLKAFCPSDFDESAKLRIKEAIQEKRPVQLKNIILLAGYVGAAQEFIHKRIIKQDITNEDKWTLALALARMGYPEQINYCVSKIKEVPLTNDFIYYLIPDLLYIRQKEAFDYCIELLNNDSKACTSSDPDYQIKILCGYRILELIAPYIKEFPFKTDGTGSLNTNDYEEALQISRAWFNDHKNYMLDTDLY